jgi:hypothetical protein
MWPGVDRHMCRSAKPCMHGLEKKCIARASVQPALRDDRSPSWLA